MEDPPALIRGNVIPVSGITANTPPIITNTWQAIIALIPIVLSCENLSWTLNAARIPL